MRDELESTAHPDWQYSYWKDWWRSLLTWTGGADVDISVSENGEALEISVDYGGGAYGDPPHRFEIHLPLVLLDELRSLPGKGT